MMVDSLFCIDINLQHCKAASANLALKLHNLSNFICFIQEPWINGNRICGLRQLCQMFKSPNLNHHPRACIITSDYLITWQINGFCNRDQLVILTKIEIDGVKEVVFSSKYMPYEVLDPADQLFIDLIEYCTSNNKPLIINCDTNAHHVAWGSSDTNNRGFALMDYLMTTNMIPFNKGNKSTFMNY